MYQLEENLSHLFVAPLAHFFAMLGLVVALEFAIAERLSAFLARLRIAPVSELLRIQFVSIVWCSPGQVVLGSFPMDLLFNEFQIHYSLELGVFDLVLMKIEVFRLEKDSVFEK